MSTNAQKLIDAPYFERLLDESPLDEWHLDEKQFIQTMRNALTKTKDTNKQTN